jgi:alpha-1,2-mannosyltransferase
MHRLRALLRPPVVSAFAICVIAGIAVAQWIERKPLGIDSTVYRAGAGAVARGHPLYGSLDATQLPFTYPPIASIGFLPLATIPPQLAWGLMGILSTLALGVVLRVTITHVRPAWGRRERIISGSVLLTLALQPVWETIAFGQVNLVIMAFVVVDVLTLRGSRFCGILTGVAAAIKLTPLIFVVHLVVTGRRADAVRVVTTFVLLQLCGAAALPADSVEYWTSAIMRAERWAASYAANQSLNGMLHRLTEAWPYTFIVVSVLAALSLGVAILLARRFENAGRPLEAILSTAMIGLVISPISWPHHWVWVAPVCLVLLGRLAGHPWSARDHRCSVLTFAGVVVVFSGAGLVAMPIGHDRGFGRGVREALLGNLYLLCTLLVVAAAFLGTRRARKAGMPLSDNAPATPDRPDGTAR